MKRKNKVLEFSELVAVCKANALNDALNPTEEIVYKRFCRAYSQRFHVALGVVYTLDPEHVIGEIYASQLEEIEIEEQIEYILDEIYTLEDPDYAREKENDLSEFIADAEELEQERVRNGKPIHKAISKAQMETKLPKPTPDLKPTPIPEKPIRGNVDFSSLDEG